MSAILKPYSEYKTTTNALFLDKLIFDGLKPNAPIDLTAIWPYPSIVGADGGPVAHHLGQQIAWESFLRIVAMIAGTQGGKTAFGPWWLFREIFGDPLTFDEEKDKDRFVGCGAGDYIAVTSSYDLFKLKMLPSMREVFEEIMGVGRFWSGDRILELAEPETGRFWANKSTDRMWGRIILRSAQSLAGLESATAKGAWLDEAGQDEFILNAYKAIRRRLALNRGRILITTTLYNLGWVKSQVIDRATDGGEVSLFEIGEGTLEHTENKEKGITLVQFDSIINPAYPIEEFEEARELLPQDEFEMQYRGRVARLRTLIYNVYDDRVHRIPHFDPPPEWPRMAGLDPVGERVAALFLALDVEKRQLHAYREYAEPFGITTAEHALNLKLLTRYERIFAWAGGGPSERQQRADFAGNGIPVNDPIIHDVWAGIDRVYALLKNYELVIHDNCEMLDGELKSYRRKRGPDGEPLNEIENKNAYHLLDCLRYIICFLTADWEFKADGRSLLEGSWIGQRY